MVFSCTQLNTSGTPPSPSRSQSPSTFSRDPDRAEVERATQQWLENNLITLPGAQVARPDVYAQYVN